MTRHRVSHTLQIRASNLDLTITVSVEDGVAVFVRDNQAADPDDATATECVWQEDAEHAEAREDVPTLQIMAGRPRPDG